MGPFPHDAPAATISADNPMGTDGFEFVEYAHPRPASAARAVQADGLCAGRAPQDQEDHGLSPGRHQLSRQRGARHPRLRFRRRARAMRAVDGVPRGRCEGRPMQRALSLGAEPAEISVRRRRRSMFPRSRASAAACSISSIAMAPRVRLTMPSSNGSAPGIRGPRAPGCSISITSPTTSIAAAWTSGPASTKNCSISGRSASSISRAARPACSRAR